MVTTDTRNNLIVLTLIVAISIIVGSFIVVFSNNLEKTSNEGMVTVKIAAKNVTDSMHELVALKEQEIAMFSAGFSNLSSVLNKQYNLTLSDAERDKENLGLFFSAFENQTDSMVKAINEQKESFVDTLGISQNLTRSNLNATLERNNLTETQIDQFEELIQAFNGTLRLQPR